MAPAHKIPVDSVTPASPMSGGSAVSNSEWCTGTLVSLIHVLTAAHCVYDITDTHKFVSSLSFSAGIDGATSPFGTILWSKVELPRRFTNHDHFCAPMALRI